MESNIDYADRIAWAVDVSSRCFPKATCLTLALTAKILLTRAGLPSNLHIGVIKDRHGALQAHAWVRSQDKMITGGAEVESFTPLSSL